MTGRNNSMLGPFNSTYGSTRPSSPSTRTGSMATGMNKRDKKRLALQDRLSDISHNYTANRDRIYRDRVRSLHADISYINQVSPFDNVMLDDSVDGEGGSFSAAASTVGSVKIAPNGSEAGDATLGKHAAMFVQEMNDALEQKDANLVLLGRSFDFEIEQLQKDYVFAVSVAQCERDRLMAACRQRLIANAEARRSALIRDKEKLDIADTNALLYHPTQFSTSSPAGLLSNRKTRHTRHRLEADEPESKRRRKLDDPGSPVREPEPPTKSSEVESEPLHADLGIEKLFSEKELNSHLQAAVMDVIMQSRDDLPPPSEDEDLDVEPTIQSLYMTRSARTVPITSQGGSRDSLGELAGRERAAELFPTFRGDKRKDEDYNRAPALSEVEAADDLALIAQAMKSEDALKQGQRATGLDPRELLEEFAGVRPSWVRRPDYAGQDFGL